jgi:hypothetical protein
MDKEAQTRKEVLDKILTDADAARKVAEDYLVSKGIKYSLSEWVTIQEYAKRFSLESTNAVLALIAQRDVPLENVIIIEELNNLMLIKAGPHKDIVGIGV